MARRAAAIFGYFPSQGTGIYRTVSEDLVERLASIGWQVTWASAYPNRILRLFDTIAIIWRKREQYDVAHVDVFSGLGFVLTELTCWALHRLKKPYVLTLRGGNLPIYSQKHPNRVRRLLQSAVAVTAPSRFLQEALRPFRDDIQLVPNPISLDKYRFRVRSQPQPNLLWLRSMHSVYNPTLAVRVIALLRNSLPDVHLSMVGPDKGDGTVEAVAELIQTLGLEKHIDIIGGVPSSEVPDWMDKADIFLNTTNVDNTPLSVIQAMGSGLCIVSTNVGGLPALIDDGLEGLLVPPDNAEAMANAIVRVLTEPELAESLSRAAHACTRNFDWSVVLQQWDQLLSGAIN
jgi:glycosyltransferase involved in cell wall biosynthesis